MRSPTASIAAVVLVAIAASCASDDSSGSDDTDVAPTTSVTETTIGDTTSPPPSSAVSPDATTPATAATTIAPPAALVDPVVALIEVGQFDQPVDIAVRPGDTQLFVVEQPGRVVVVTDLSNDVALDITDLTDADGERGLLGLAFDPTGTFAYVDYIDGSGDTVVAEFAVDPTSGMFDLASRREVLTVDQPYANHNGGQLAFGPDGMLYVGLGDGGSGGDPERNGLDRNTRLGKILRIDPHAAGDEPFTVPADNPFVGVDGADPTIWALGLRNPWRFSFDLDTGDLWIADVGQGDIEEIDHAPATERRDAGKGLNFGWSAFEGRDRFNDDQSPDGVVDPIYTYDHGDGRCSVSGGVVARNSTITELNGWYVFGDYCSGQIWALDPSSPADSPRVVEIAELVGLAAIAQGPEGELYAISNGGTVARFIAP